MIGSKDFKHRNKSTVDREAFLKKNYKIFLLRDSKI